MEKYEPYGLSIYYGETDFFSLSLLATDKEFNYKSSIAHKDRIPVVSIGLELTKAEFEAYYKRFHILLTKSRRDENYEIVKEISIEEIKTPHNNT